MNEHIVKSIIDICKIKFDIQNKSFTTQDEENIRSKLEENAILLSDCRINDLNQFVDNILISDRENLTNIFQKINYYAFPHFSHLTHDKIKNVSLPNSIQKEVIIINDCSFDNTKLIIENYISKNQIEFFIFRKYVSNICLKDMFEKHLSKTRNIKYCN